MDTNEGFILIYSLAYGEYHHNKPEYNCYQMEYDIEYHSNTGFTLDIKWSFDVT